MAFDFWNNNFKYFILTKNCYIISITIIFALISIFSRPTFSINNKEYRVVLVLYIKVGTHILFQMDYLKNYLF